MWNAFCLAAGEGFGVRYGWSIGKQSTGLFSLRRETRPFRATDSRSNYSNPCRLRKKTAVPNGTTVFLAAGEGFEPSQTESESGVLPLHKPAICLASKRISNYMQILEKVKQKIAFSEKIFCVVNRCDPLKQKKLPYGIDTGCAMTTSAMWALCILRQGRQAADSFSRKSSSGLFLPKVRIGFRLLHARCALSFLFSSSTSANFSQS